MMPYRIKNEFELVGILQEFWEKWMEILIGSRTVVDDYEWPMHIKDRISPETQIGFYHIAMWELRP